jgi:hypothetical protein
MSSDRGVGLKLGKTGISAVVIALEFSHVPRTAYQIARLTNYSPQHINRCLRDMWEAGLVGYVVEPHRQGEKRLWVYARGKQNTAGFKFAFTQDRLPF